MRHFSILTATGCLLLLIAAQVQATTVNVSVTIIVPPCVISDGRLIEVKFGDEVMTSRIDGSNYETAIPFTLVCTGPNKNAMQFQIRGAAGFESGTLATEQPNLAIKLLNGGVKFSLNEWNNFDYPGVPALSAVLVKQSGASLVAGAFSASATMMVDYQ